MSRRSSIVSSLRLAVVLAAWLMAGWTVRADAPPTASQPAAAPSAVGQPAAAQPVAPLSAVADCPPTGPGPLRPTDARIDDLVVSGRIEGANVTVNVSMSVHTSAARQSVDLISGEVALAELIQPQTARPGARSTARLIYSRDERRYTLAFEAKGPHRVNADFAVRSTATPAPAQAREAGDWRMIVLHVPVSRLREVSLRCDRTDLEIDFPGAMRVDRKSENGSAVVTAVLGPDRPLVMRWKPVVGELAGELVMSSTANAIAAIEAGAVRLDTLMEFAISQGKLAEVAVLVPSDLSITQVRGAGIRDWRVDRAQKPGEEGRLVVTLVQPQTQRYALQVIAEKPLPPFPTELVLAGLRPASALRHAGHLAVGTESAIHLLVRQSLGLSQIEPARFPRELMDPAQPRKVPAAKSFFYSFAGTAFALRLGLVDVTPTVDALHRITATLREDDLWLDDEIELDIRDAPIRSVVVGLPSGWIVARVEGPSIGDFRAVPEGEGQRLEIAAKTPWIGRVLLRLRLELGRTPLDKPQAPPLPTVAGARQQRGYVVIAGDTGIEIDSPAVTDLTEMHTGAAPMSVASAQYAYRFRDPNWTLRLTARRKPAGVRAEVFELLSLADGTAHGSATFTYVVTGAPVDEFRFSLPASCQNVEFIGNDVRRWSPDPNQPGRWSVKLVRKVIGDYNLGLSFTQRYGEGGTLSIGGIRCEAVQSQSGYIATASHESLELTADPATVGNLLEVDRQEVPGAYRLLVGPPLLKTFKHVGPADAASIQVTSFQRGTLLSALVEVMEARTTLGVREGGKVESATRVRYKVKNASSQFLTLRMPAGATVWSTYLVQDAGQPTEKSERIAASFDAAQGWLMIPLPRLPNPNQPTTIDVEYGQSHADLAGAPAVMLEAPVSGVRSTFARWSIQASPGWAIEPAGGNMMPDPRTLRRGDIGDLLRRLGGRWESAIEDWDGMIAPLIAGIAALLVLLGVLLLRRPWLADAAVALMLAGMLWLGVRALLADQGVAYQMNTATAAASAFTQPISLDESAGLNVKVSVVPLWRFRLPTGETLGVGIAALLGAGAAIFWPRRRALLLALAIAAAVYVAAFFPAANPVLTHLLTWGLPAVLALWWLACVIRSGARRPGDRSDAPPGDPTIAPGSAPGSAPAAAPGGIGPGPSMFGLLLMVGGLSASLVAGCAATRPRDALPLMPDHPLDRVLTAMSAERDSMSVKMKVTLTLDRPGRVRVAPIEAVLMSGDRPQRDVTLQRGEGWHEARIARAGTYEWEMTLLLPLEPEREGRPRSFAMDLPMALSSRATLTVARTDLEVASPRAVRLETREEGGATVTTILPAPGEALQVSWRPRARQTRLEKTVLYVQTASVARVDTGSVEVRRLARLQVTQGELTTLRLRVPEGETVTDVRGRGLGGWRFDAATQAIETRWLEPVTGAYEMLVVTQRAVSATPYEVSVGTMTVEGADRQRGTLGVVTAPAVFATPIGEGPDAPTRMNVEDFSREEAGLLSGLSGTVSGGVRVAYRVDSAERRVRLRVESVQPELRVSERSGFTVADERLVYSGELAVEVSKAGVFSLELHLPAGYDIDALEGRGTPDGGASGRSATPDRLVSHWDETAEGDEHRVTIHLTARFQGTLNLKLGLSRTISELPSSVAVPRVGVVGSMAHSGEVVVSSDRGVRLSVTRREGASEFNLLERGVRTPGAIGLRLLRPDWEVALATEVLEPRVTAEYLHVASVSEGLVRHTHYLLYRLHNGGSKEFEVRVPAGVMGLVMSGPDIARREEVEPGSGRWRIELSRRWFDRPYPLTLRYETSYDRSLGRVTLSPPSAQKVALQRGDVAVLSSERVELSLPEKPGLPSSMQVGDARALPRDFGAGDLSAAVMCFGSGSADWTLELSARRYASAATQGADVRRVALTSVLSPAGESITRVEMEVRVGVKRYLEAMLPSGASVWSLSVSGRATSPARRVDGSGRPVLLVPLALAAGTDLPVMIELVYVTSRPANWTIARPTLEGPRFDLPLRDVRWTVLAPDGYAYSDFDGTLTANEAVIRAEQVARYDARAYETALREFRDWNRRNVETLQGQGEALAQQGKQFAARQALEVAVNYSLNDPALNEDARVQLNKLANSQAVVGMVQTRGRLRSQMGGSTSGQTDPPSDAAETFTQDQALKMREGLSKDDSDNLDLITRRLVQAQEEASGPSVQLVVNLPTHGRVLEFDRSLQVTPDEPMRVSFAARAAGQGDATGRRYWGGGWAAALLLAIAAVTWVGGRWDRLRGMLRPRPRAAIDPAAAASAPAGEIAPPMSPEDPFAGDDLEER